eukprot:3871211-Rhodomonas_salina.1
MQIPCLGITRTSERWYQYEHYWPAPGYGATTQAQGHMSYRSTVPEDTVALYGNTLLQTDNVRAHVPLTCFFSRITCDLSALTCLLQTDNVTYEQVDYGANSYLLSLAQHAKVRHVIATLWSRYGHVIATRFVFVSVLHADKVTFTDM